MKDDTLKPFSRGLIGIVSKISLTIELILKPKKIIKPQGGDMNQRSKTILFVMAVVIICHTSGMTKTEVYQSQWQTKPLSITGDLTQWQGSPVAQMKKLQIDYRFVNNNHYLYGLLTLNDMKFFSSMNQTGLTVWINQGDKKKKKFGINFLRGRVDAETFIKLMEKQHGPMPDDKKAQVRQKRSYTINQYKIIKKGDQEIFRLNTQAPVYALFHMQLSRNNATIEFRIPLEAGPTTPVAIGARPGDQVTLGFSWGGLTDQMRKEMMRRRAEAGSRTSGGRPTGLTSERRVSSGYDAPFRRPKKYIFWTAVNLAAQK